MRLSEDIKVYFKQNFGQFFPEAKLYLFGSRTDDTAKGGDIDLMILSENQLDKKIIRKIRIDFFKKFGWQKIDIVNFTFSENTAFRKIIENTAIEL